MIQESKTVCDLLAFGVCWASVTAWLPPIAALFSIIWMSIRFYEYYLEKRKKK